MNIEKLLLDYLKKPISAATTEELYFACLELVKACSKNRERLNGHRKLYYVSAEFLIGKLLSNNLINLGYYDELSTILRNNHKSIAEIEEFELEPSLGNGGLGRLAACFLDSIATLGLSGDGIGLNYHLGLFKQTFKNLKQTEEKNEWITEKSWLTKTDSSFIVKYKDFSLKSVLYDIDVIGYNNGINKLHLFDVESINEDIVQEGINFDKTNIIENLTLFLYPDDSDEAGQLLRIYQQYFMVSNGAQYIINEAKKNNIDLHNLHQNIVIQINDTHPTLIIPELIYLLMSENITMKEAIHIVSNTCAYTNHTILSEALEKWPRRYLAKIVPHLLPIIEALDAIISSKYSDPKVQIIDEQDFIHMAHIDIHFSFSVNGVAAIHTEILKNCELKSFYDLYPSKFNNKTNGITFRRWLMHCNHELSNLIDNTIGTGWKSDALQLENLISHINNNDFLDQLYQVKQLKKQQLVDYIKHNEGIQLDSDAVFCIQIKRLHEYKRQQMNALYIIWKYFEIKKGNYPTRPVVMIFGCKAAPAYTTAKNIIHLLLCLQELVNNDPLVSKHMKVIVVENYNVTYAEKLIPACDVSEQISLASKEASGTGNMKFMLNGAVTLGTQDGANVEIAELVGQENIYTFGQSSNQVIEHYNNADYISKDIYDNNLVIKEILDFIVSDELFSIGDKECLTALYNEILNKDWFMTLLDLNEYIKTKEKVLCDFEDVQLWQRKMLVNIAKSGYFSSDRTIKEYNDDIWHLD